MSTDNVINLKVDQEAEKARDEAFRLTLAALDDLEPGQHRELMDRLSEMLPTEQDVSNASVVLVWKMLLGILSGRYEVKDASQAASVAKQFSGLVSDDLLGRLKKNVKNMSAEERAELRETLTNAAREQLSKKVV